MMGTQRGCGRREGNGMEPARWTLGRRRRLPALGSGGGRDGERWWGPPESSMNVGVRGFRAVFENSCEHKIQSSLISWIFEKFRKI
jgi:hypothetical protein